MLMVFMRYALGGFMIPLLALALLVLATDGPVQTMREVGQHVERAKVAVKDATENYLSRF